MESINIGDKSLKKMTSKAHRADEIEISNQIKLDFYSETVKKIPSLRREIVLSTDKTNELIIRQIVREPMRLLSALTNLTLLERRLYWLVLSKIKNIQYCEPQNAKPYASLTFYFHSSDIIYNDVKWSTSYMKDVIKQLGKRTIAWDTNDGVYTQLTVFPTAQYITGQGVIMLHLHPLLIPGFLELGNNFAQYELNAAMKLTSEYGQILYSWISRHVWRGTWLVNLEEFRQLVGASNKSYAEFSNLRIRVLKPAIDQINEHTDLLVSYKTLGQGKKVTSLEFDIAFKKSTPEIEQTGKTKLKEYLDTVNSYTWEEKQNFAHDSLRDYYKFFSPDQKDMILRNREYLQRFCIADCYISAGQVKNDKHEAYMAKSVFNPVISFTQGSKEKYKK